MRRSKQPMKPRAIRVVWLRICRDLRGQDMIEYALMAGAVALASAAFIPNITGSLSTIFSKVGSIMGTTSGGS
jgi:pilus assembly protein Flp/PilA